MRKLLQNKTDKTYQKFITKCGRGLLKSPSSITNCNRLFLQSSSGITKYDSYFKVRRNTTSYSKNMHLSLHEKPYSPSAGISWKAQKDHVNIIFTSTFWLKKDRIFHQRKVQNKTFPVVSKNHLSINFLAQKKAVFPISKMFKTRTIQ